MKGNRFWLIRCAVADDDSQSSGGSAGASAANNDGDVQESTGSRDSGNPEEKDGTRDDVEHWKHQSRKWEERAKKNHKAAQRLQEIEDADKSEMEKLQETVAKLTSENDEAKQELCRLRLAAEHGLSAEDANEFLHGDEESMAKQAKRLAERLTKSAPSKAEDPTQGRGSYDTSSRESIIARAKKLKF